MSHSDDNHEQGLEAFERVRGGSRRVEPEFEARDWDDEDPDGEELDDDDLWDDEDDGLFRKILPIGIGLVLVAIVGGGILVALNDGETVTDPNTVPLVQALPDPEKVKPDNPGGLNVEHQDKLILNEVPTGQATDEAVERLLPPPEVPLDRPQPEQSDVAEAPEAPENETPAEDRQAEAVKDEVAAAPEAALKPEDKDPSGDLESVLQPPPAVGKDEGKQVPAEAAATAGETTKSSEAPQAAASVPTPAEVAKVVQPSSGQYVVQLASLRTESDARTEWGNLQKKLPKLLGRESMVLEKADIPNVGVRFRLQTGPFPAKAAATEMCQKLKAAGRDCLVKKVK
ncbi:SPOR domain-containing protein [Kiloniella sp. b19]|uniref:SPOR domain-containing protein n=1 Tax=Kiloniella sp. GXU_MW_B19 TaxID=3141326 RepID=UPI0031CFE2F6